MTDLMQLHQFPPMFDDSQEVNQMRFSCNKFQTLIGNSHNQVTTLPTKEQERRKVSVFFSIFLSSFENNGLDAAKQPYKFCRLAIINRILNGILALRFFLLLVGIIKHLSCHYKRCMVNKVYSVYTLNMMHGKLHMAGLIGLIHHYISNFWFVNQTYIWSVHLKWRFKAVS